MSETTVFMGFSKGAVTFLQDQLQATLLRREGLSAWIDHPDPAAATDEALVDRCTAEFQRLKPVCDFLCDGSKAE